MVYCSGEVPSELRQQRPHSVGDRVRYFDGVERVHKQLVSLAWGLRGEGAEDEEMNFRQ